MTDVEMGTFTRAWISLLYWRIRLRVFGPPADVFAAIMEDKTPGPEESVDNLPALVTAVDRARRYHFVKRNCLLKSLVLRDLLRSAGISARIAVGVKRDADHGLQAHAWVIHANRVVGDRPEIVSTYQEMRLASDQIHAANWLRQSG